MHHIQSDILTFHLSPILPELRWRVLRYVWLNPRMSQWVQWFFSLPSVAWDDFARARPAHSMRETVRARGKAANCVWFPDFVSGLRSGEGLSPCYRWGDQCTVCRAWFKGSCLKIPLFCWKFPFFCHYDSFFWLHKVGSSVLVVNDNWNKMVELRWSHVFSLKIKGTG